MPAQGEGGGGRHGLRSQHQRQPAEAPVAAIAPVSRPLSLGPSAGRGDGGGRCNYPPALHADRGDDGRRKRDARLSQAGWVLKRAEIAARIRETSGRFGLDLNPDAVIGKCRSVVGSASSPAALSPAWVEPCYPFSRSEPFTDGMIGGRGNLALASLIVARWNPLGAALACLAFGAAEAFELRLQNFSVPVNSYVVQMAPYLIALAVLAGLGRTSRMPAAIGQPLPWDQ
jgi:hypothetical protein